MVRLHSILASIVVIAAASPGFAQAPAQPGPASPVGFTVFVSGAAIGSEQVTLVASADGWSIRTEGRLGVPINLTTSRFELKYDRGWKPLSLEIDAALRGQPLVIRTAFDNGKAANVVIQGGQQRQRTDDVAVDTVVLPDLFFGAYEALAQRLAGLGPGARLSAYIAPVAEIVVTVIGVDSERIQTPGRVVSATRYNLMLANPRGPLAAEVWADQDSRLLRFRLPSQGLDVARDDISTISARVERLARPSDEQVRVSASGFALVGTLSKPAEAPAGRPLRRPAVVLVPGAGPVDRDETLAGVPIFAQLANAIADAGFVVVRYDKRGIGQSGGRDESAGIPDFADDARLVVRYLEKRADVDPKRIALVGHGEGGMIAMLAASADKRVAALALISTPGTSGAELVLEQQRHELDAMKLGPTEREARIDLQKRIQAAVITGNGWDGLPAAIRRQADTAWFRSVLTFDPAKVMRRVSQPALVLQGDLDRQVPARHGQLLLDLAVARKKDPGASLARIEGINHLLVPAVTGEADEYAGLRDRTVSPKLVGALVDWLKDKLHVDTAGAGR